MYDAETPDRKDAEKLWKRWIELWNGDFAAADEIIAPRIRLHLPTVGMPDPAGIRDGAALASWIGLFRSSFDDGRFTTVLGPLSAQGAFIVGRWRFEGGWRGGRPPGATAAPGTRVRFHGHDILRVQDGRIAEYWLCDDLLDVYAQLGAEPVLPAAAAH